VQGRLRSSLAALVVAGLVSSTAARAQSFTWGGATTTPDYNLGTNWANPPAGAPPVTTGQSAIFDATGAASVVVTGGPVAPDSWTFNSASQSYAVSGTAVTFSLAGSGGGIINNANSGQTVSISNNIGESVAGVQVQQLGNSTLVLSGANAYTGGTIIDAGTLQLGTLATKASIVGAVTNAGVFSIVNANTTGITSITNNGGLTTFLNAASASSAIIDNLGGRTTFGVPSGIDTATAGNATITTSSGGSTIFDAMTTAGSAKIATQSGGAVSFVDNSNAGNATVVNRQGGSTIFNGLSNADNASITNNSGSFTYFGGNSSAGNSTITNNSLGSPFFPSFAGLNFLQASTAGNATILNNNGLINFGFNFGSDVASADHATITNNFGRGLNFNAFTTAGDATITTNSGAATYFNDHSTGGNAQFITTGTGYVDFSFSRGPNSDGRIAAGSISGSGTYYVGSGNTLTVGSNNLSTEVSGTIADVNLNPPCNCTIAAVGPGTLEKVGTGTLTLSGVNTYTGPTKIDGGTLSVNGSIASSISVTVNAGGTLSGNGIVDDTTINGGTLAPGNSVGLLTVQGSLVFTAASSYLVQVSSSADRTSVSGVAALGGATVSAMLVGGNIFKQYTILNATGGISGTFNPLVNVNVPNFIASLSYDAKDVYLNFAYNPPTGGGFNINQKNVVNLLGKFFNANGGIPLALATASPSGLTQISGELATGSQQATFDAMNLFLGMLTDPFIAGRGDGVTGGAGATPFAEESNGASPYASNPNARSKSERDAYAAIYRKAPVAADSFNQRWSMWGASYGGGSTTDGNTALGSNTSTARAFGVVAGSDYRISPDTLAGFALAGGGTNFSVNNLGSGRSDLFQAGAFVRHNVGAAYVSAALAYGWQDVTTDRTVTVAGVDRLHAEFNANAWSGRVEGGYRYVMPWMGVTPYAAGQFTTFSLPAYAEQALSGSGAFALSYAAKDVTDSRSELGVRTDKSFAMPDAILTLRGRLAWAHDFNADRNIQAVFQTLPGASFVVNGAAQAHDSALTTASAEMKWLNGFSLAATFEGEFSGVTTSYAGKGVARYAW
jgi:autotransporter-associated beta strand protein